MRFPIPELSLDTYLPPVKAHPQGHFWLAAEHPFEPRAAAYSPVNAWWLAEAALLAYHPESDVKQKLPAQWKLIRFLSNQSTQAYIAGANDAVIVAFRGTEIRSFTQLVADWLMNFTIQLEPEGSGKCHGGFLDGVNLVYEDLVAALEEFGAGRPIWFTGHSLGAALATIAAGRYAKAHGLYTFGSPRVGDIAYGSRFPSPATRIVNHRDPVANVPRARDYSHLGAPLWIDAHGQARRQEPELTDLPLPHHVIDHAPILYSIHLANLIP